jgi:hypothetical protein
VSTIRTSEKEQHTFEQIGGYLDNAFAVMIGLELDEAERAAVLPVLVSLFAAKHYFHEQVQPIAVDLAASIARANAARS